MLDIKMLYGKLEMEQYIFYLKTKALQIILPLC